MEEKDSIIKSLLDAVKFSPDNLPLRKHLAETYIKYGDIEKAENILIDSLKLSPNDLESKKGLINAYLKQGKSKAALVLIEDIEDLDHELLIMHSKALLSTGAIVDAKDKYVQALDAGSAEDSELEDKLRDLIESDEDTHFEVDGKLRQTEDDYDDSEDVVDLIKTKEDFSSVGGMEKVKEEIQMKIILPLTNKDLFAAYGKKIGGGILMYGPPGCGKTHLARATAGEVNASFISVGLNDVLNMWIGQSEERLHKLFEQARRNKPCVLFFDEVDALGASRSDLKKSTARQLINQFLSELDGVSSDNEGVLILAATNTPWHLDSAFKRPGRFDRIVFVPPPDLKAREEILKILLKDKPCEKIDFSKLAKKTHDYSGADLKALIDIVIEEKLREAMKTGIPAPINSKDLLKKISSIRPSTKEWFSKAKNYALYSNEGGIYDDILDYLK